MQATSPAAASDLHPPAGDPVITIAPAAAQLADDPAVAGFEEFIRTSARTFQNSGENAEEFLALITGNSEEVFRAEIEAYKQNGWRLVGTPRWEIIGVQTIDDTHRRVLTCEYDAASYPVDVNGVVVRPMVDDWLAGEAWMLFTEGRWILEDSYAAEHECEIVQ